jgi:acyl-CoA thioesterase-1
MLKRYCIALLTYWLTVIAGATNGLPTPIQAQKILVVGDSLSAEYGIPRGTGWVALLAERLQKVPGQGTSPTTWTMVNASISGDTSSGGRTRLAALLKTHQPRVVILELGGNDALRGLPIAQTRDNLEAMVKMALASGAKVLVLGIQVPPNYGQAYTAAFANVYTDLSKRYAVPLLPFFLTRVADSPDAASLFQADRIHPNQKAQPRLADNVWPLLAKLIQAKPTP